MSARISPWVIGFAAGVVFIGAGGGALLTFVLGDVFTDAGSRWMTFAYTLFASIVLAGAGSAVLAGVLALSRPLLPEWTHRASLYGGATLGAMAAIAAGIGVLPAVARAIAPVGGRASWILAAGTAGAAAALIVIALSAAARVAKSQSLKISKR